MSDATPNESTAAPSAPLAFVTGATGMLGANLVRELLARGRRVRALARDPDKARRVLGRHDRLEIVPGDMLDVDGFAPAMAGADEIYHAAAYFREYYQPGDHDDRLHRINVLGTRRVLEAADAAGVRRAVHVSSSGVLGESSEGDGLSDESAAPNGISLENGYFRSKVDAEREVDAFLAGARMDVVIVRPGWMMGPWDAAPTSAGQIVVDFLARDLPAVPPGGQCMADPRDVAAAMIAAAERGGRGERYNVAGRYVPMAELLAGLERVSGVKGPRLRLPPALVLLVARISEWRACLTGRPALITRSGVRTLMATIRVDSNKAERDLNATFRPLDATLRDTVEWFRARPDLAADGGGAPAPARDAA